MSITLRQIDADNILKALPSKKAATYLKALQTHGTHTADGWVFPECEAMLKAMDMFYPTGRPPGPSIVEVQQVSLPSGAEVEAMLDAQGWTAEAAKAEARGGCGCSPPVKD